MSKTHWARPRARVLTTPLLCALVTACGASRDETRTVASASAAVAGEKASNAVILEWNTVLHEAALAHDGHEHGLAHVRVLAMLHLAQHDAVNAVAPAYESYAFTGRDRVADPIVAAASAAHAVLVASYPKQAAMFDARLEQALKDRGGPARTRGVELGKQAALAILERREQDGAITADVGDYEPRSGPGAYQFVPPFDLAFAPGWRAVEPFALQAPSQFRPDPLPSRASLRAPGGASARSRLPASTRGGGGIQ